MFFDELADLLSLLDDHVSYDRLVICGDLYWPGLTETSVNDELLMVHKIHIFEQFVLGPTREGLTSCRLLNPVIGVQNPMLVSTVTVCISFNILDHRLMKWKLSNVRIQHQSISFHY